MQVGNIRCNWIDRLRAIGIALVVLGHTLGISDGVDKYIFSFHMPLFFFLSGFLLTPVRLSQPWGTAVFHYWRRLLLPYVLFSILTYLPWVLLTRRYGADVALGINPWRPLFGTLYGIGVDGWLQHNAMLWFFPCLFALHLMFRALYAEVRTRGLYLTIGALACVGHALPLVLPARLPFGLEIALIALPFYALGHALASKQSWLPRASVQTALLMGAFGSVQLTCIMLNGRVDMNFISLGNPLLFYTGAVAGIGALGCFVAFLPPMSVFTRVADAAVLAFPLHRTVFSAFSAAGLWLTKDLQAFKLSVWGSVSYTVGALLVAVLLMPWVRLVCPVLIGGR